MNANKPGEQLLPGHFGTSRFCSFVIHLVSSTITWIILNPKNSPSWLWSERGELKQHLANSIESEWITNQYLCLFADSSSSFSLMQHLPRKRSRKPRRFQNKRPSSPLPFHLQLRTSAISAAHIFRCCHKHRLVASEEAPVRVAVPCQTSSWADRLRGSLLSSVSPSVLKIHCRSQVTRVSTQTSDWLGVLFTEISLQDQVLAK